MTFEVAGNRISWKEFEGIIRGVSAFEETAEKLGVPIRVKVQFQIGFEERADEVGHPEGRD